MSLISTSNVNEYGTPLDLNGLPIPNLGGPGDDLRNYCVVAHNYEDLESLYNDMENEGGPLHIPNRVVECVNRKEYLRTTDYMLTYAEAVALHNDPRVHSVEINFEALGIKPEPLWTVNSTFLGSYSQDSNWSFISHRTKFVTNPKSSYDPYGQLTTALPDITIIDTQGTMRVDPRFVFWRKNSVVVTDVTPIIQDYDVIWLGGDKGSSTGSITTSAGLLNGGHVFFTIFNITYSSDYIQFTIKERSASGDLPVTTTAGSWSTPMMMVYSSWAGVNPKTTLSMDLTGKNVDYVNYTESPTPYLNNLEYAQNVDGTGYNRAVQYPWISIVSNDVDYGTTFYPLGNNHGAHTSSMAVGNRYGFAKDSNIYLTKNGSNDVIAWHNNKIVNPLTGVKNPTVVSDSHGTTGYMDIRYIAKINCRGTDYFPGAGDASLGTAQWSIKIIYDSKLYTGGSSLGINLGTAPNPTHPVFADPLNALTPASGAVLPVNVITSVFSLDKKDMISNGIIVICAAGNSNLFHDRPDGLDYNNYIVSYDPTFSYRDFYSNPYTVYYNRGNTWTGDGNVMSDSATIVVGSHNIGTGHYSMVSDYVPDAIGNPYNYSNPDNTTVTQFLKSTFSNYGPGIAVFAAGSGVNGVMGSTTNQNLTFTNSIDYRAIPLSTLADKPYKIDLTKEVTTAQSGTSGASPCFAGIVACMLEKNPSWKQKDVWNWIYSSHKKIESAGLSNYLYYIGTGLMSSAMQQDAATNTLSPTYAINACDRIAYIASPRFKDPVLGADQPYNTTTYPCNIDMYRPNTGLVYPRNKKLINYSKKTNKPTFNLSASSLTATNGQTITVTLTTTNLDNGTKVRYIIGARHQPSSANFYTFTKSYLNNTPLVADLTVNSNTASFNIPITTTDNIYLYVRLDIFPTPYIVITVN